MSEQPTPDQSGDELLEQNLSRLINRDSRPAAFPAEAESRVLDALKAKQAEL